MSTSGSPLSAYQKWKQEAKAMIAAIPYDGATIIVATNDVGRELKRGITDLRGRTLARKCRTISVYRLSDCDKLDGLLGPMLLDHSFLTHAKPDTKARVEQAVRYAVLHIPTITTYAQSACEVMQG